MSPLFLYLAMMQSNTLEELIAKYVDYAPEDLKITFDKIEYSAATPFIDLNIATLFLYEVKETQRWRINITGLVDSLFSNATAHAIEYTTDHPLLWKFTDVQTSLYFNGTPANFHELYWELHKVYISNYDYYGNIEDFLNQTANFEKLMTSGFGLFASGPQKLLHEFAKCLEQQHVKSSMTAGLQPRFKDLSILFLGGSYIIGQAFNVEKIQ